MVHKRIIFILIAAMLSLLLAAGAVAPVPVAASELLPETVSKAAAVPEPILAPVALSVALAEPEPVYAALTDPYFANEGIQEVIEDAKNGYWLYRSSELFVEINRVHIEKGPKTYFVAEVRTKQGGAERAGFGNPKKPGRGALPLYKIARNYNAVIAVNGDYMNRADKNRKGIIIRDGKLYLNNKKGDTLAFYPDGSLRVFKPGETTAARLLEDGVVNTFSFGPTLVKGGVIQPNLHKVRLKGRNPRTAVGMVEPNHYILVVADGRQKKYSVGLTMVELADVFAQHGCEVAYNLDGGRSATMSFMGSNISRYGGSLTGQRKVPDALMFGFCDLAG